MKWFQRRDENTTVVSYVLEDEAARTLATIERGGRKGFLISVPPSKPFSRPSVATGKRDAEWIIVNRTATK